MNETTTAAYVPEGRVVAEPGPAPYIKIALPITVRELRTLLENIPGGATIGDGNPYWQVIELGIYRGESDRPNLRNP